MAIDQDMYIEILEQRIAEYEQFVLDNCVYYDDAGPTPECVGCSAYLWIEAGKAYIRAANKHTEDCLVMRTILNRGLEVITQ